MLTGRTAKDFIAKIGHALANAELGGIHVTAGGGACDLEAQQLLRPVEEEGHRSEDGPRHLEGSPSPKNPGTPDGSSRLCYFLDGVQSTHEIGRIGPVPIVATTVAAAIINRCDRRFSRMPLEVPPTVVRAVILPRGVDERIDALYELFRKEGLAELPEEVPISFPDLVLDSTWYATTRLDPSDYVGVKTLAFGRARTLRERLESELLQRWEGDDRVLDSEDWIAVDGQLRRRVEDPLPQRAIGLVKSVARPEFKGEDVGMLLDLEVGMRTTSFVPGWQLQRPAEDQRTSWYLRMWPQQRGADALGSVVRVEASRGTEPERVDEITRWILAERAPLATPDPRWPAMIYPIHYVEKILKPLVQGSERAYSRLERRLAANGRE